MRATLFAIATLLIPALMQAQAPIHNNVRNLNEVATRAEMPSDIRALRDLALAQLDQGGTQSGGQAGTTSPTPPPSTPTNGGSSASCTDYIVTPPMIQSVVAELQFMFHIGCPVPKGSWIISEQVYNPKLRSNDSFQVFNDEPVGSDIYFSVDGPMSQAATEVLIVITPNFSMRIYQASLGGQSPFTTVSEQFVPVAGQLIITVKGIYDAGLHALFGDIDITKRAIFIASDTVTFDVTDIPATGTLVPITISQHAGTDMNSSLVLHGAIQGPVRIQP